MITEIKKGVTLEYSILSKPTVKMQNNRWTQNLKVINIAIDK